MFFATKNADKLLFYKVFYHSGVIHPDRVLIIEEVHNARKVVLSLGKSNIWRNVFRELYCWLAA